MPQVFKNVLEFCTLLLISPVHALISKIVLLFKTTRKTDTQKNAPYLFCASKYPSTDMAHVPQFITSNYVLPDMNLIAALELCSEQAVQLHTAHLPIR